MKKRQALVMERKPRKKVMAGKRFDNPPLKIARNAMRSSHGSNSVSRCNSGFIQVIRYTPVYRLLIIALASDLYNQKIRRYLNLGILIAANVATVRSTSWRGHSGGNYLMAQRRGLGCSGAAGSETSNETRHSHRENGSANKKFHK